MSEILSAVQYMTKQVTEFSYLWKWKSLSCVQLCDPMDYSLPGSSVYWILQARILERVAIPFSRWSFQPRDETQVLHIAGGFSTIWATRELTFTWVYFV